MPAYPVSAMWLQLAQNKKCVNYLALTMSGYGALILYSSVQGMGTVRCQVASGTKIFNSNDQER